MLISPQHALFQPVDRVESLYWRHDAVPLGECFECNFVFRLIFGERKAVRIWGPDPYWAPEHGLVMADGTAYIHVLRLIRLEALS